MKYKAWISAHLFYHDDPTQLLVQCVKPLVDELYTQQLITKYFFIRYWQGGPHIRLRLLPAPLVLEQTIREVTMQRVQAFFLSHPSTSTIDSQHYETVANSFAFMEYGKAVDTSLYANNSLHYIPYEPEYERYGGEKAMSLVETHFMQSSAIVLQYLSNGLTANRRMGQATIMTLLALALYTTQPEELVTVLQGQHQDLEIGLAYIRTHYEDQFSRFYQRAGQTMQGIVYDVLEKTKTRAFGGDDSLLRSWTNSVETLCDKLQQLEAEGLLQKAQQLHVDERELPEPTWRAIVLLCLHMHNNRLGLAMVEEAYIRSLLIQVLSELMSTGVLQR